MNGEWNGVGKLTFDIGNVYVGGWKKGLQYGKGRFTFVDDRYKGCVYEGLWSKGKRHGQGTFFSDNDVVWSGHCNMGKPSFSEMRATAKAAKKAAQVAGEEFDADADAASTETARGLATVGKQLKRKRTTSERKAGKQKALDKKDGFVDMPRSHDRSLNGGRILSDGNVRSCGQDALVMGCKVLGVPITKKKVYEATLPAEGDTKVGVIVNFADTIGVEMLDARVPSTLGYSIFQQDGGPAHALLQIEDGVFWVELRISQTGKKDDRHVVMYDASFTVPEGKNTIAYQPIIDAGFTPDAFHLIRGVVRDNDKDTSSKYLDPSDRGFAEKDGKPWPKARDVFNSLFPLASKVQVDGVWLMRKKAAVGVAVV